MNYYGLIFLIFSINFVFCLHKLEIKTKFPIKSSDNFIIKINNLVKPTTYNQFLMVIVKYKGKEKSYLINLSYPSKRTRIYMNDYFQVMNAKFFSTSIEVSFRFSKKSHGKAIEIFHGQFGVKFLREVKEMLVLDSDKYFLTKFTIDLCEPFNLKIVFQSNNMIVNKLTEGETVSIICSASNGFPKENVQMIGIKHFHRVSTSFEYKNNVLVNTILVKRSNHGNIIGCKIGKQILLKRVSVIDKINQENTESSKALLSPDSVYKTSTYSQTPIIENESVTVENNSKSSTKAPSSQTPTIDNDAVILDKYIKSRISNSKSDWSFLIFIFLFFVFCIYIIVFIYI